MPICICLYAYAYIFIYVYVCIQARQCHEVIGSEENYFFTQLLRSIASVSRIPGKILCLFAFGFLKVNHYPPI